MRAKLIPLTLAVLFVLAGCDNLSDTAGAAKQAADDFAAQQPTLLPAMVLTATECAVSLPPELVSDAPEQLVARLKNGELVTASCTRFFEIAEQAKEDEVLPLVEAILEARGES